MSGIRALLVAVAMILAVITLASCRSSERKGGAARDEREGVTFVLFDISGSTVSDNVRRHYMEDFGIILTSTRDGDTVAGDLVTDNSLATAAYPVWGVAPRYDPFVYNRQSYLRARRTWQETLTKRVSTLILGSTPAPRTDIMSALQLAAKVFNGDDFAGAREKRLVLFSDMVEQSASYDFMRERLTPQRVQEIIERERRLGRLPDLTGVTVWISGAGMSSGGVSSRKITEIRDFWLAYFAACHAELTDARYAPRLINYGGNMR